MSGWEFTSEPADVWREKALCRPEVHDDPELFFPPGREEASFAQTAKAKDFCRPCEVKDECLAWALRHGIGFGVWGATSAAERERIRRGRSVPGDNCPGGGHPRTEDNVRIGANGVEYCLPCCRDRAYKAQEKMRQRKAEAMAEQFPPIGELARELPGVAPRPRRPGRPRAGVTW